MTSVLTTSASAIGSIITSDAEFTLPALPYLPPELVVLPFGDSGLLFEGAGITQVITGRGARGFLPRLLPKLDGKTSIDVLGRSFLGTSAQSIVNAIALLFSRGLLEDGFAEPDAASRDLGAFLGRNIDATRANANRTEAIARLARTRVQVIGSGAFADLVCAALSGSGLHSVERVTAPAEGEARPDFIVAAFTQNNSAEIEQLWETWNARVPILHASISNDAVEIGPLFLPASSACYSCFRSIVTSRPGLSGHGRGSADSGFWAGVVALQAHHVISRVGKVTLYNTCHVHQQHAGRMLVDVTKVARLPGCQACGLGHCQPIESDPDNLVWRLHNATNSFPPQSLQNPKDYQAHFAAANIQLTSRVPLPWYGTVRSQLPLPLNTLGAPAWHSRPPPAGLDLSLLSTVLRFVLGERHDTPGRRLAPSAGGLSSPETFLVIRNVDGIEPGAYRYDPPRHALDRLQSIPDALLAATLGIRPVALPPVIVFGTGMTEKVNKKYGDMAFRFTQLDGGVIKLYLHDTANALGLPFVQFPDVREGALMDALSIPQVACRYIPTFAAGLGNPRADVDHAALDPQSYVHDLAELSSLPPTRPALGGPFVETGLEIARDLGDIVRRRHSARDFGKQTVSEDILRQIGLVTCNADRALASVGGLQVRMRLWAAVASGERDGATYSIRHFDQVLHQWVVTRTNIRPEAIVPVVLQRTLSKSPFIIFVTADFEHAVSQYGARGYREVLARAGSMGARSMLAAEALGLIACPWGGITDDSWADILSIDRYQDCPMFGISIGHRRV